MRQATQFVLAASLFASIACIGIYPSQAYAGVGKIFAIVESWVQDNFGVLPDPTDSPADNEVLTYDAATGYANWEAAAGGGGGLEAVTGARVYKNANQSINDATTTDTPMTTEVFDTDSFYDDGGDENRFTIPAGEAGIYMVNMQFAFAASTGDQALLVVFNIRNSGGTIIEQCWEENQPPTDGGGADNGVVTCTYIGDLDAGDYVEWFCYQRSGGALNVLGGTPGAAQYSQGSIIKLFNDPE